jgi:hypothetical protein
MHIVAIVLGFVALAFAVCFYFELRRTNHNLENLAMTIELNLAVDLPTPGPVNEDKIRLEFLGSFPNVSTHTASGKIIDSVTVSQDVLDGSGFHANDVLPNGVVVLAATPPADTVSDTPSA